MRREDVYGVYAVIPPQAARNPEFYVKQNMPVPTLRVVREDDDGVVISGMKMLATGAVFANEIWIGNLIPLAPNQLAESITCAIPVNAPGVTLWSRKPFERHAPVEFENPLTWRFDETDSMVMCDERQGAVGAGVRAHGRGARARDLHQDAGPLLRQPPVERALPRQDAAHRRPGEQDRARLRRATRCRRCARCSGASPRSRRRSAA